MKTKPGETGVNVKHITLTLILLSIIAYYFVTIARADYLVENTNVGMWAFSVFLSMQIICLLPFANKRVWQGILVSRGIPRDDARAVLLLTGERELYIYIAVFISHFLTKPGNAGNTFFSNALVFLWVPLFIFLYYLWIRVVLKTIRQVKRLNKIGMSQFVFTTP